MDSKNKNRVDLYLFHTKIDPIFMSQHKNRLDFFNAQKSTQFFNAQKSHVIAKQLAHKFRTYIATVYVQIFEARKFYG